MMIETLKNARMRSPGMVMVPDSVVDSLLDVFRLADELLKNPDSLERRRELRLALEKARGDD